MGDGQGSSGERIQRETKLSIYNSGVAIKKFVCALCCQECETDVPDEVAMAEAIAIFGDSLESDPPVVCDDCFEMMKREDPWLKEQAAKFKTAN
jgi:hypothetical protein